MGPRGPSGPSGKAGSDVSVKALSTSKLIINYNVSTEPGLGHKGRLVHSCKLHLTWNKVKQLALSLHSKEPWVWLPGRAHTSLCGVCTLCQCGFSPPPSKSHALNWLTGQIFCMTDCEWEWWFFCRCGPVQGEPCLSPEVGWGSSPPPDQFFLSL